MSRHRREALDTRTHTHNTDGNVNRTNSGAVFYVHAQQRVGQCSALEPLIVQLNKAEENGSTSERGWTLMNSTMLRVHLTAIITVGPGRNGRLFTGQPSWTIAEEISETGESTGDYSTLAI